MNYLHTLEAFFGLPLDNESTPAPPKWVIQKLEEIRSAHSEK